MNKRNRKNKKAISTVVATVLIILITVAAVAIVWTAVIPMIRKSVTSGTSCLDAVSQITIVLEGTCRPALTSAKVQVSRGAKDFDLKEIQFLFYDASGNPVSANTIPGDLTVPAKNQKKIYTWSLFSASPTKVEIAPVIGAGSTKETCSISSSVDLSACT